MDYPTDLSDFDRFFPDEAACERFLERLRWPQGFVCPACGHTATPWRSARGHLCVNCRRRASVTAGTIFQGTRKPLRLWFITAWEIVGHKYGANALNVKRMRSTRLSPGSSCKKSTARAATTCVGLPADFRCPASAKTRSKAEFGSREHANRARQGAAASDDLSHEG